jgi:hypothetical protein
VSDIATSYHQGAALARAALERRPVPRLSAFGSQGVLIAEGDSWFDYPFEDVLESLHDEHGFDVESVAHLGDNLEDMAYDDKQLDRLTRAFQKVAERLGPGGAPRGILLSGGGNDIAGEEFAMLLNHSKAASVGLNAKVVDGLINERLREASASLIGTMQALSLASFGRPVRILVHGYGRPVPDGRGFLGGALFLPGPWLEPGFRRKGYADLARNTAAMASLIDGFNTMLAGLAAEMQASGVDVRHVDLRTLLRSDAQYQQDWANELHPTKAAFRRVATAFAAQL